MKTLTNEELQTAAIIACLKIFLPGHRCLNCNGILRGKFPWKCKFCNQDLYRIGMLPAICNTMIDEIREQDSRLAIGRMRTLWTEKLKRNVLEEY